MRDFAAVVRAKLGRLPVSREREEEIVTELAHQMEDAYRAAVERGAEEAKAFEEAVGQIDDWEKFRQEILSAERGEAMLWPHPNAIPRRVSWCALALVAALCLIPGFRQAMRVAPEVWSLSGPHFSESALRDLASRGLEEHDARMVAFAALHLEDRAEASRLAEQAVKMDPSLTWIGSSFVLPRHMADARVDSATWTARLEAWDPDNAVPHLLAAELDLRERVPVEAEGSLYDEAFLKVAATTPWGKEMAAAVAAPRYDDYVGRAFELNRSVLARVDGGQAGSLTWYTTRLVGTPNPIGMLEYASLITRQLGPEAEAAKRYDEAAKLYGGLVRFGMRKEGGSSFAWGRVSAYQIEKIGYQHLAALYEKTGRGEEAASILLESQRVERNADAVRREWSDVGRARWESGHRSGALAWIAAWMAVILGLAVAVWIALLGFRSKERVLGGWAGGGALAVSYAPLLLLGSTLLLFTAVWPHLGGPEQFASADAVFTNFAPFWFSFWAGPNNFDTWRILYIAGQAMWAWMASLAVLIVGIAALRRIGRMRVARAQVE
ncbi:MAG TPA: hypothetical protein VLW54_08010 [Candidatus Acidoferrales bacterium]|nr:hypothetical protein [Candidatus Acidoferrales bacterium]